MQTANCLMDDTETRQAYFRNMHSKCQCSCVLQFTRHHRVSSVLNRPLSQIIHFIIFGFLYINVRAIWQQATDSINWQLHFPTRGRSKTRWEARTLYTLLQQHQPLPIDGLQWIGGQGKGNLQTIDCPAQNVSAHPGGLNQLFRLPTDNDFPQVHLPKHCYNFYFLLQGDIFSE